MEQTSRAQGEMKLIGSISISAAAKVINPKPKIDETVQSDHEKNINLIESFLRKGKASTVNIN